MTGKKSNGAIFFLISSFSIHNNKINFSFHYYRGFDGSIMLFRSSSIRGLLVLIVVNIFIYAIFLRRTTTDDKYVKGEEKVFYSPSASEKQQSMRLPSILQDTPMYDELSELENSPIR